MTPALRLEILSRSNGLCECGCGADLAREGVEVDHFFGRAKSDEGLATCWALTRRCHFEKTQNSPSAAAWLEKFVAHCDRHSYAESKTRAQAKLFWRTAISEANRRAASP